MIVGTLDTKGAEILYLKDLILKRGHNALVMDLSMGRELRLKGEITPEEVAKAAGVDIEEVRALADRGQRLKASELMVKGAIEKVKQLYAEGKLHGIVALGGHTATVTGTTIMRALPFGVPKLMISSTAGMPAYVAQYIGTNDVMLLHSVLDIAGLNDFIKNVLERGAGAICGAIETVTTTTAALLTKKEKPLIAITEFGFSEKCCTKVKELLKQKGYEVIAFHAQGVGDRAMEDLLRQGYFDGVIDVVPAGVSENLFKGNRDAGPNRLEAAGERGLPQVVTPCGFEMISCGPYPERTKQIVPDYEKRKMALIDPLRAQARTTAEELKKVAKVVAEKLNKAKGPVKFLIPLKGWSSLSRPGGPLHEPETDMVFVEELRKQLKPEIEVRLIDAELNDPSFAEEVFKAFEEAFKQAVKKP
ncbi:MAG: Tm-1-like ATP-binding domain-containing protein [Candidatus Nezhaarchaeales archaeon]